MILQYLVALSLLASASSMTTGSCVQYNMQCTMASSCCNSPAVMCLPDARNTTSCLSPLDLVNLSPLLTGSNLLLGQLPPNSTGLVKETIQLNGNTLYNATQLIGPQGAGSLPISGASGPAASNGMFS